MHELARQHYLEAMGIQTYMPRLVLPAAPIPMQCDLSGLDREGSPSAPASEAVHRLLAESVGAEGGRNAGEAAITSSERNTAVTDTQGSAKASTAGAQSVNELLASMGTLPAQARNTKPEPKAAAVATAAPIVPLSVSLWQFAGLIVLADRHPEQALPVNLLLKNILVALGRTRDKTDAPEVLKWPLEGVPVAQAGPALTYFSSIILARRLPDQETTLLCFGAQISEQLLSSDAVTADSETGGISHGELTLSGSDKIPAIALPSLEDILRTPSLKPAVWQALAKLRLGQ